MPDILSERAPRPVGLRESKKRQTRERIREHALRLFLDRGFDQTRVEEIADAAGVSYMTFFRYFPAKHDVIGDDLADAELLAELERRPVDESAFEAVHRAAVAAAERRGPEAESGAELARLILSSPSLRSWLWERHRQRERGLAAAVLTRDPHLDRRTAAVLAAACVAVMGEAVAEWVADPDHAPLGRHLDRVFSALRAAML